MLPFKPACIIITVQSAAGSIGDGGPFRKVFGDKLELWFLHRR